MGYCRQTALPASEPLPLDWMKNYLRLDSGFTQDDDLISGLITAAREYGEKVTGRALAQRGWRQVLDSFPYYTDTIQSQLAYPPSYYSLPRYSTTLWNYSQMIKLVQSPVKAVTAIRYVDTDGNAQSLQPPTIYGDLVLGTNPAQVSSAASPFGSEDVGEMLFVTGGTGFTKGGYTVESVDANGVATLDRSAGAASSASGAGNMAGDFVLDLITEEARIFPLPGQYWPACLYVPNAVEIDFVAGYDPVPTDGPVTATQTSATPANQQPDQVVELAVPRSIIHALALLVHHWYDRRSEVGMAIPAVDALLQSNAVLDFAPTRG